MKNKVQSQTENNSKEHKKKHARQKVLTGLAAFVVFCTTYALILPAITWERSLVCEVEAHTHTASCYEEVSVPAGKQLICTVAEHTHGDGCYEVSDHLICTEDHEHTDACYERTLVCEQTEHTHGDSCYEEVPAHTESRLCCGKEEHIHTDACFDAPAAVDSGYYCGCVAHKHSADQGCFNDDGSLKCTIPEHEHSLECTNNPNADVEGTSVWESSFADIELTDKWDKDVIAIAESQLGYKESTRNFVINDDGSVSGYTRYGAWYGNPYGDWCGTFCAFVLHYAGVDPELFPASQSAQRWVEGLCDEKINRYVPADDYTPKAGDLIFFDYDEFDDVAEREADHMGFVYEIIEDEDSNPVRIKTIEGNTPDGVSIMEYDFDDETIMGFGKLPKKPKQLRPLEKIIANVRAVTDGNCWQLVTTIDDKDAYYLIVSDSSGYAMGVRYANRNYSVTSTKPTFVPISGYNGYYTATVDKAYMWKFSAASSFAGTSAKLTNVTYNDYGLRLNNDTIISTTANETTNTFTYRSQNSYWRISYGGYGSTYYLVCNSNGTFSRNTSNTNAGMKIYKLVEDPSAQEDEPEDNPDFESLPYRKQLDAFRDGADNPDTTLDNNSTSDENLDLYRLYVEFGPVVATQPIDLLLVVDTSGSMYNNSDATVSGSSNTMRRDRAVTQVLNGTYTAMTDDGFITKFLTLNNNNRVAVVTFDGVASGSTSANDARVKLGWTKYANRQFVSCITTSGLGTNYCAGLQTAATLLANNPNNHQQVMVFLSDGVPTYWNNGSLSNRSGTGSSGGTNERNAVQPSKNAFDVLKAAYPDLITYTIGFGEDFDTDVLDYYADSGKTFATSDVDALNAELETLLTHGVGKCRDLTLTDTLSAYVDIYDAQPDFKVCIKTLDGDEIVLYTQSGITGRGTWTAEGREALQSFTYDPATKTVTAKFNPDYQLEYGSTYLMSYNVHASETAYSTYYANVAAGGDPYGGVKGDEDTDHLENKTSSEQPGFYSNSAAQVSYWRDGTQTVIDYPHPVIQVLDIHLPPVPSADMPYSKQIDYLGDGDSNPDTTLEDDEDGDYTDLYRLYLNVGPVAETQPIDLLVVVDQSTSMRTNSDATVSGSTTTMRRDYAVTQVLNGSRTGMTDTGFITNFLKMNYQNRLAVVGFDGVQRSTSYANETRVLMDWTTYSGRKFVDCTSPSGTKYTNYCSAMKIAEDMLKDNPDNHLQVMVFLSDGEPTIYLNANGTSSSYSTSTATNFPPSKAAFDTLIEKFPGLYVYSIGFGASFNTEVLDYMASSGETFTTQNVDALNAELHRLLTGGKGASTNLVMTDTLSEYVNVYEPQPDFKISIIDVDGKETVLYTQSGMASSTGRYYNNGANFIDSFTYDAETKTITVDFKDNLDLEPGTTYRVSYNVQVTEEAYTEFKQNVAAGEDGYGEVTGDDNTDFGINSTSSGFPGFHSNASATATYTRDRQDYLITYDHPVVQVVTFNLPVEKIWADGTTPAESVTMALYQLDEEGDFVPALNVNGDPYTIELTADTDWKGTFLSLDPAITYYVTEIVSGNYVTTYAGGEVDEYEYGGNTFWAVEAVVDAGIVPNITVTNAGFNLRVEKVWVDNTEPADYVTIALYQLDPGSGEVVPALDESGKDYTIVLSEETDWMGTFTGLDPNGTYYVSELNTDGYFVTYEGGETDYHFVNGQKIGAVEVENDVPSIIVNNYSGHELPYTGGEGTFPYYLLGIALLLCAAVIICKSKREFAEGGKSS